MRSAFILLVLGLGASCGDENDASTCSGSVDDVMSSAAGTITITGDFSAGQPIAEITQAGGIMLHPAAQYTDTTATFTGLPTGMHTVNWLLSCFDNSGQVTMTGPGTITVP